MHRSTSDEASTIGSIEATSRPFPLPFHLPPSTNSSASFSSNPITVIYLGLESTNSTVVSLDNAHQSLASASESNIEDSQQTSPRQDSDSSGVGIGRNNTFVPSKVKSPHGRNRNLSLLTASDSLQTELGTGQTVREGLDRGDSRTTISGTHSVSCAAASGGSMSSAAMQAAPQHAQAPNSSASYGTGSSSRHYQQQSPQTRDPQYAQSRGSPSTVPPSSRRAARQQTTSSAATNSPASPEQYYSPSSTATSTMNTPRNQNLPPSTHASPVTPLNATSPSNSRHRNGAQQQFDGPPIPPPRTSSSQRPQGGVPSTAPLSERVAASRQARQHADDQYEQSDREVTYGGEYISGSDRERSRDDTSTAAASAARNRRKVPHSPEGPHRATSTRDSRGQQSSAAIQSRSEATMGSSTGPGTLSREESTVINRVVVTDPQVDIEREQERLAEARPAVSGVDITPITGLGLVGSEGVDDGGRGAGRTRQDHAATSSRRKEIKFGEYMLGQTLGEGEFGKVKLGWKKDGSVQVAIKLIRRENLSSNPSRLPKIYREISILRELSHPNIVRLHEMVETDRHIGIILEYASGGELFDYILKHRYLKDNAARRLFAQLVSGVGYLHKKGIVHRDLKLENLLLDRNRNIIITDFGFANTFDPVDELGDDIEYNLSNRDYVKKMGLDRQRDNGMRRGDLMQTSCGSPCYAAPELVVSDSLYTGRKVDVWSCGVILYAMLAGYLPFDDDPANPEGDNINLLYKYIVTTPLTFPEYVTPHARDLLRRILVPDPRKRADLFEVARHSWLSEYAHVVSHITSSTTNVADIANSTVPSEDHPEPPLLNRSASVREPTRQHQSNISPVGGLSHQQGTVTQDEQAEKPRPQRDAKRRTVQVEYVAPQSQTARGDSLSSPGMATSTSSGARARSGSQPRAELSGQSATRSKPLPQDPPVPRESRQAAGYGGSGGMPPPSRPGRDVPRSVSDSSGAFGGSQVTPTQIPRPNTGGSMTSGGRSDVRLPSRGSYGQPVAPTVAATNAQGKLAQPKNGKQYVISGPISQQQPQASNTSIGRPSTQQLPAKYNETSPLQEPPPERGHKRSNTLSGLSDKIFGRTPSISGNRAQINSPRQKTGKRYPPTSMKEPAPSDNPRQSTDSRRSSFGFGRKKSDLEPTDKSRRFSFIPASFSLRSFSSSAKDPSGETEPEMSQVNDFPQPPSSRGQPRTQAGMVKGPSRTTSYGTEEGMPLGQDGQNERMRNYGRQQPPTQRMNNARPDEQQSYNAQPYAGRQDEFISGPQYQERSYLQTNPTPPVEANNHANSSQHRPIYPEGFNSNDPPAQPQGRQGKGPGVLQKNNRRFADAYEYEQDPTHHAGSSGAARKVMDFFRRRGKARSGDDR